MYYFLLDTVRCVPFFYLRLFSVYVSFVLCSVSLHSTPLAGTDASIFLLFRFRYWTIPIIIIIIEINWKKTQFAAVYGVCDKTGQTSFEGICVQTNTGNPLTRCDSLRLKNANSITNTAIMSWSRPRGLQ